MNYPHKYALLPLLLAHAWVYAENAGSSAYQPTQNVELEKVEVKGRGVKSFSAASDDNLRDRANLGLLGK